MPVNLLGDLHPHRPGRTRRSDGASIASTHPPVTTDQALHRPDPQGQPSSKESCCSLFTPAENPSTYQAIDGSVLGRRSPPQSGTTFTMLESPVVGFSRSRNNSTAIDGGTAAGTVRFDHAPLGLAGDIVPLSVTPPNRPPANCPVPGHPLLSAPTLPLTVTACRYAQRGMKESRAISGTTGLRC